MKMNGSIIMRSNMWEKIKNIFIVIHKSSYNEQQEKISKRIMLAAEIIVEVFMLVLSVMEFRSGSNVVKSFAVFFVSAYIVGIVCTLLIKGNLIPSIIFNLVFLYGFSMTFYYGTHDNWGAMWMFVIPALSMYIMNFAVSFWTCLSYSIIATFFTFYPPTREVLLTHYSEVFLSRYYIIYDIDFIISFTAMLQIHMMRYNQNRTTELLEAAVKEEHDKVASVSMETILSINNAVQAKDLYTGQHSQRVSLFSCLIAEKLGWKKDDIDELRTIALLHDIGKIGVDEKILNKPSKLTDEEYVEMKNHTVMGGEILKDLTLIPNVDLGAKSHHERYDGRGYPEGLSGEDIPIEARIIGIADTFDAMNFSRVYRKKCDLDYVKGELERGKGTQFDPHLVEVFMEVCQEHNWFRDLNMDDL